MMDHHKIYVDHRHPLFILESAAKTSTASSYFLFSTCDCR